MTTNLPKLKRGRSDADDLSEPSLSENIVSLLEGLNAKMDVLNTTVTDNSNAIKDIDVRLTTKIDNLEATVADNINRVKMDIDSRILSITTDVNNRLENLESATQASSLDFAKVNDVSAKLETVRYDFESRFNKLERELLRNELVVTGVPASYGENVMEIIGDISGALQSNLNGGDVVAAYRLPTGKANSGRYRNGRPPAISAPIILKLGSDWAKQELVSAYFKKKDLSTADIGYKSRARIYLNESLTKHNRDIFKAATEAKMTKAILKCYTRNGIVHIQIQDDGKTYRINCIDHLNALLTNNSSQPIAPGSTSSSSSQPPVQSTSTSTKDNLQTNSTTTPDLTKSVHNGDPMDK